jgi:hypothetical protein
MKCARPLGLLSAFLLGLVANHDAGATVFLAKVCLDKNDRVVDCDPDKRSPGIVKGSLRRFHKAWDQRQGDVTLIDMRNGWFRIMYQSKWEQNVVGDKFFCSVRLREFTDGWGRPEESDMYYYLRIDEAACRDVGQLAKQAQAYRPFDWSVKQHLVCDSPVLQQCLSGEFVYRELVARLAAGHINDDSVEFVGYQNLTARQRERLMRRLPTDTNRIVVPPISVIEYSSLDGSFCARFAREMLICGASDEPMRVMLFQNLDE